MEEKESGMVTWPLHWRPTCAPSEEPWTWPGCLPYCQSLSISDDLPVHFEWPERFIRGSNCLLEGNKHLIHSPCTWDQGAVLKTQTRSSHKKMDYLFSCPCAVRDLWDLWNESKNILCFPAAGTISMLCSCPGWPQSHVTHSPGSAHSYLLKGWFCENGVQHQMYHQPCAQTIVDNYPLGYFSPFTAFAQLKSNSFARSQNLDFDVKTTTTTKQTESMDLLRRKPTGLLKSTFLLGVPKCCPCWFQSKFRPQFFPMSFIFSTTTGKDEEDTELDRQTSHQRNSYKQMQGRKHPATLLAPTHRPGLGAWLIFTN